MMSEDQGASLRVGLSPKGEATDVSSSQATSIPRAAKRPDPEKAIADYVAAYTAEGHDLPFRITYERGWVLFKSRHSSFTLGRHRVRELGEMAERIRARARDRSALAPKP